MRFFSYITIFSLLLLAGCGMPEYEKRLDAQRTRIANFDEAGRLLDEPIELDMVKKANTKGEPMWRVEFFLRLPKGYSKVPKESIPYLDPFPCYRYGTKDGESSIFIAANLVPDPKGKEKIGEYSSANFRSLVRSAIADYYLKATKTKLNITDKAKLQDRVVAAFGPYPETAAKLKYDVVSYSDVNNKQVTNPMQFDVYTHEAAGKQACIIVQHPVRMQNADAFNKNIEACLSTLDLSSEAPSRRAQFGRK